MTIGRFILCLALLVHLGPTEAFGQQRFGSLKADRIPSDTGITLIGETTASKTILLLDDRVVDRVENAVLRMGKVQKHPSNPLFGEDKPWELRVDNMYPTVVFDSQEGIYRCWYNSFLEDVYVWNWAEMGLCYATSRDGLHWEKPELGVVEFNGSKANNLVARRLHGAGVFMDTTERDPARRFKMICSVGDHGEPKTMKNPRVMAVAFSPDGWHWSEMKLCPEIGNPLVGTGDTHNNALWAPEIGKYVGITRKWSGGRVVVRTESPDFIHWTEAVDVMQGEELAQTYSMPVFRYAGVYLGLVSIYNPKTGRVHCELARSPDTVKWTRIQPGTSLIPTSDFPGDYDWGCVYAAAPVIEQDGIQLYYGASDHGHEDKRKGFLALATLRPDGFAGYEPKVPDQRATVVTRPLTCTSKDLTLTADAQGGSITVSIVDEDGVMRLESEPIEGNVTETLVSWKNCGSLEKYVGSKLRLQATIRNAKVYAFGFMSVEAAATDKDVRRSTDDQAAACPR